MIDVCMQDMEIGGLEGAMKLCMLNGAQAERPLFLVRDVEKRRAASDSGLARIFTKLVAVQKSLDVNDQELRAPNQGVKNN